MAKDNNVIHSSKLFKEYVSANLRDARERAGVSKQGKMANLLDKSQATVSGYESGEHYVSTRTIQEYAVALGYDVEINFIKRKK